MQQNVKFSRSGSWNLSMHLTVDVHEHIDGHDLKDPYDRELNFWLIPVKFGTIQHCQSEIIYIYQS